MRRGKEEEVSSPEVISLFLSCWNSRVLDSQAETVGCFILFGWLRLSSLLFSHSIWSQCVHDGGDKEPAREVVGRLEWFERCHEAVDKEQGEVRRTKDGGIITWFDTASRLVPFPRSRSRVHSLPFICSSLLLSEEECQGPSPVCGSDPEHRIRFPNPSRRCRAMVRRRCLANRPSHLISNLFVQDEIRRLSAVAINITAFAFVCEEAPPMQVSIGQRWIRMRPPLALFLDSQRASVPLYASQEVVKKTRGRQCFCRGHRFHRWYVAYGAHLRLMHTTCSLRDRAETGPDRCPRYSRNARTFEGGDRPPPCEVGDRCRNKNAIGRCIISRTHTHGKPFARITKSYTDSEGRVVDG
ncbi:hypothetical protein GW17_00025989 [Ensete ventricosum]|nr:hypothetical protein GW17_00025989 [Ensete ventricosum]